MNNNNLNFRSKIEEKYVHLFEGSDLNPVNSTGEIYINRIHSDTTAYESKMKEYRRSYLNMKGDTEKF